MAILLNLNLVKKIQPERIRSMWKRGWLQTPELCLGLGPTPCVDTEAINSTCCLFALTPTRSCCESMRLYHY